MKYLFPILVLLAFWGLAGWSLVSGISDCYTYFFTEATPTGGQVAWAILRIIPIAEILFVIGWVGGFASLVLKEIR